MLRVRLARIVTAISVLLALILDELWRMGRLREWTWEWAVAVVAFVVIVVDVDRLRRVDR
jgi:hypothetical protein